MAQDTLIQAGNEKPPSSTPPSTKSSTHLATATSIDPIVIDDDDDDEALSSIVRKGRKGTQKIQKPRSSSSLPFPKRRRKSISIADDANASLVLPREFDVILSSINEDNAQCHESKPSLMARVLELETALSSIREENQMFKTNSKESSSEIDKLRKELGVFENIRSDLSNTQEKVKELDMERSQLLKTIQQLENQVKDKKALEDELECVRLQNSKERETRETLEGELAAQSQFGQEQDNKLAETTKALKNCESEASLARTYLRKAREESIESGKQLQKTIKDLASSRDECNILSRKLVEAKKECELLSTLRTSLMAAKIALDEANQSAEKQRESLQQNLDTIKKDQKAAEHDRDLLQKTMDVYNYERAELQRRIYVLEAKEITDTEEIRKQAADLAAAKLKTSTLTNVESELQASQQQVAEMNMHMETCPIAQKPQEFWDEWTKETDWLKESLANLRGRLNNRL
ncbi:hypothetical protein GGS24DRAFT_502419 [Hypoxylon argillaceum]|nr:hypothetical protein GGS24DRAFT_502419 [Hypoxylon argillaceum]